MSKKSVAEAYISDPESSNPLRYLKQKAEHDIHFAGIHQRGLQRYEHCNKSILQTLLADPDKFGTSGDLYREIENLSYRPWNFRDFSTGMLFAGIASSFRTLITIDSGLDEPPMNERLGVYIAERIDTLRYITELDNVAVDPQANAFFASTAKLEPILGSDLGIVAHSIIGDRERCVVALLQAKKVTSVGATARVDRPADSPIQLGRRLITSLSRCE